MKPPIVLQIENLFDDNFQLNLPKNQLDPVRGVMGAQKNYPKYAVDESGALVGLNLAETQLDDLKWRKIVTLLEQDNVRLQALDLNENRLTEFALTPCLSGLKYLDIDDNPVDALPDEIKKQGKQAVLRFLKDLQEQGARELYEVKLLIVGEGETGKTTLWKLLQNPDHPVPDQKQKSTVGIQIKEGWRFKHLDHPDEDFLVNLWDFGGQDIQYMTHQFFLTRRSFYVLLADGRREVANFPYWLQIIELLGCSEDSEEPLPVLVVLNEKGNPISKMPYDAETVKTDYKKLDIIRREVDFAKKEDGRMEALSRTIKDILCHQIDHLPLTIPAFWDEVRQELYELRKTNNHIKAETFEQICKDKGIEEAQQQDDLSQLLHDLGVILYFREDVELADFIILNPQWAVNAIYEIMRHEEVKKENQGRFDKALLQKIWNEKGYTKEEQSKLLNLMLKDNLEVCFSATEDRRTIYIAPQLLPEKKPEGLVWQATPDTLRYIYHYPFMPKGIIGRLIVQLHENIETRDKRKVVWENGMVIKKEECRAQVQFLEDKENGRQIIKMEVQGASAENRKNVLRDIRQALESIHRRSFPSLRVFQKVPCNCTKCTQSVNPFEHDFFTLKNNKAMNGANAKAQCNVSFENVPVQKLLEGVFNKQDLMERSESYEEGHSKQPIINNIYVQQDNQNIKEETTTVEVKDPEAPPKVTNSNKNWWLWRLVIAFFAGLIIAYFGNKYFELYFLDTWLASSSFLAIILLARNPHRRFYWRATIVLALMSGLNILPQLDFGVTADQWYLNLSIQDNWMLNLVLGVIVLYLFYLDSKQS